MSPVCDVQGSWVSSLAGSQNPHSSFPVSSGLWAASLEETSQGADRVSSQWCQGLWGVRSTSANLLGTVEK